VQGEVRALFPASEPPIRRRYLSLSGWGAGQILSISSCGWLGSLLWNPMRYEESQINRRKAL
jgi:hypothetical protein